VAFGAAEVLVDCVVAERPKDYDRRWHQLTRRYRMLAGALLQATKSQATRGPGAPFVALRLMQVRYFLSNKLV
jgi:hypothetical protein